MTPTYYDEFKVYDDLRSLTWWNHEALPTEEELIYAGYTYEDYDGD